MKHKKLMIYEFDYPGKSKLSALSSIYGPSTIHCVNEIHCFLFEYFSKYEKPLDWEL